MSATDALGVVAPSSWLGDVSVVEGNETVDVGEAHVYLTETFLRLVDLLLHSHTFPFQGILLRP